ncbi:sulfotransferase [Sphingobium sp. 10 DY56-G10]|uniref:sulfotransferase n=1 Tax=Sphingobium sp. 10 DY56-G10 TaxID=2974918 RepID=UPI00352A3DAE
MQKFFVAGMPRTGSTLLATTLDQHPGIKMLGELFHPVARERSGPHAIVRSDGSTRFFDPNAEDGIEFLRNEVWPAPAPEAGAIGFKLFGDYLKAPTTERLFMRIFEAFPDTKLVTIWRNNLLDCLISRQVARASGKWMESAKARRSKVPAAVVSIDPIEAENFFKGYSDVKGFLDSLSKQVPSFAVDYDELVRDFAGVSARLFSFLELEKVPVKQALKKQAQFPQSHYVKNWKELREHFSSTDYEKYFID